MAAFLVAASIAFSVPAFIARPTLPPHITSSVHSQNLLAPAAAGSVVDDAPNVTPTMLQLPLDDEHQHCSWDERSAVLLAAQSEALWRARVPMMMEDPPRTPLRRSSGPPPSTPSIDRNLSLFLVALVGVCKFM